MNENASNLKVIWKKATLVAGSPVEHTCARLHQNVKDQHALEKQKVSMSRTITYGLWMSFTYFYDIFSDINDLRS